MKPTRPALAGIAAWLLVVAVGSALVWLVISRAGDGVVSSEAPVTTTADQPGRNPSRNPSRSPTPSPTDGASSSPSGQPPATDPVRRTWQGLGGQVTVECRGSAASLGSLIPDSGFRYEVDDRGPARVRVEFEGVADDDQKTRVDASCVGVIPVFEADSD